MRSPSGGEARHRGGTHIGKAPPSPEMLIFGLTRGRLVGENDVGKQSSSPALPDVRPAPQAGCFVSGLKLSKDSAQITLRHRAFGTVTVAASSTSAKRPPAAPRWRGLGRSYAFQYLDQPLPVFVRLLFEPSPQAFGFFCR